MQILHQIEDEKKLEEFKKSVGLSCMLIINIANGQEVHYQKKEENRQISRIKGQERR